jgi:ferredoxin
MGTCNFEPPWNREAKMTLLEEFVRVFQVPPAMQPYLHLVVDEREMELVVKMNGRAMTVDQVADMMNMSPQEAEAFLSRAHSRGIVDKQTEDGVATPLALTRYTAATFYRRVDPLAMYENWGDIPAEARDAVAAWQLQEFINLWLPVVEEMMKDPDAAAGTNKYHEIPNQDVLLLEEALEQVEAATEHVVVPCDCRAIFMACNRPLEVCIRLDEGTRLTLERGHGRRITKEECKTIVVNAHRAGLMQTGSRAWREHDLFGFCNCCTCDCYPFRVSEAVGMRKQWPRSHYVAACDWDKCSHCGLCTRRCYFGAFYRDGSKIVIDGKARKQVLFDTEKCWGCGLCATACPTEAIRMVEL